MKCRLYRNRPYSWVAYLAITLLLASSGCRTVPQRTGTPRVDQLSAPDKDLSFATLPIAVQDTHRRFAFAPHTSIALAATWFPRPYAKSFQILLLSRDGHISTFSEIPDWAVQGGLPRAELDPDELQRVRAILSQLVEDQVTPTGKGATVVAVSFKAQSEERVIACAEDECPQGIKSIFEIAERAIQRSTPNRVLLPFPFKAGEN